MGLRWTLISICLLIITASGRRRHDEPELREDDPTRCLEPFNRGGCRMMGSMYFYNTSSNACENLEYGGCNGNRNRWERKEDCQRVCKMWIKGQSIADKDNQKILEKIQHQEKDQYPPFQSRVNPKYMPKVQEDP